MVTDGEPQNFTRNRTVTVASGAYFAPVSSSVVLRVVRYNSKTHRSTFLRVETVTKF